ncbi:MAG: hypothetical protein V7K85_28280 [Nostoc sp.]
MTPLAGSERTASPLCLAQSGADGGSDGGAGALRSFIAASR